MKNLARILIPTMCAALSSGCASVDSALVDRKITMTQKQVDYKITKEYVRKFVSISGDKYDSYRDVNVSGRIGIPIEVTSNPNGREAFAVDRGSRVLPVVFECDYEKGDTKGEITLSYQDPRNLYGRIHAVIEAQCISFSPEEEKAQIEAEKESERISDERQIAEHQAQTRREEAKKENERLVAEKERLRKVAEAQELAIRDSPEFKRNSAQQSIKTLRHQINLAQKNIDEERKIGAVSGYVNASKLHDLGLFIVAAESEIKKQWLIYKENGGRATVSSEIK